MYHQSGSFHFNEVTDFYVFRYILDPISGRRILFVLTDLTGTDVDHSVVSFAENGLLPNCGVRVPVLMSVRDDFDLTHNRLYLPGTIQNALRQQAGVHSFLSTSNGLPYWNVILTNGYWQNNDQYDNLGRLIRRSNQYTVNRTSPYIVIYPCFRETTITPDPVQPVTAPELIMGVFFPRIYPNYFFTRTYCRYSVDDQQSSGASDIDNYFIKSVPDIDQNGVYQHQHYTHPDMIPYYPTPKDDPDDRAIALYVCRGAKLYVGDDRSVRINPGGQLEQVHHRSLYQQGSLVIIRGWICFHFEVQTPGGLSIVIGLRDLLMDYGEPDITTTRPHDDMEKNWDPNAPLYAQHAAMNNNKVLFLGPCESQYNSLAWQVTVAENPKYPGTQRNSCHIYVPDNAIIEDIAPWRTGFELIRARHHYERLWESVVFYNTNDNPIIPGFAAPDPGANDYLLRRILHLQDDDDNDRWGPVSINFPQENLDRIPAQPTAPDNRVYKYIRQNAGQGWVNLQNIEHLVGWDQTEWYRSEVPPAPPLLPPKTVYDPQKGSVHLAYLNENDVVEQVAEELNVFKIGNYPALYKLEDVKIYGHHWLKWDEQMEQGILNHIAQNEPDYNNNPNYLKNNSQYWFRQSVDHIKYIKDPALQDSYPVHTLYFNEFW